MDTDVATFTLSQEEVYFLLHQVHAQSIQGLDLTPLVAADAEGRQAMLTAADRALQARGIIVPGNDGELRIDATVRAAIHVSAFAPATLTAVVRRHDEPQIETYVVHHADPLWVEHTQPALGLHRFDLSSAPPAILRRLGQMLEVDHQPAPAAAPFTIDLLELEQITAAVATHAQPLPEAVVSVGADPATACLLAQLLHEPRNTALIHVVVRRGETEDTDTATFTHNQQGFWILEPASPSHLGCRPAGADEVRSILARLTEQL